MKTIIATLFFLLPFLLHAQHKAMPVESFSDKTNKQLFELYELYNIKIANDPTSASPYFRRGWLKYYLGDTLNALTDIKKAIDLDPKDPFYHYALAYIIIDKKEYQTVIDYCDEALKYDPKFVDVLVLKGSALDQLKRPLEARQNYVKALEIDSLYEDIYLQFMSSYALTNNLKEVEGLLTRVMNQYPNSIDVLKSKAKLYMHYKKYNEAIVVADELIKKKKGLLDAFIIKSAAYDSLKNQSKVCGCMYDLMLLGYIDGYEYIMKKCSKEQENGIVKNHTLQTKAIELSDQRRFDESLKLFDEAIKVLPDSGNTYYNRGKTKRKMEDHKAAIEDYLIAIKKSPHLAPSYVAAGVSYTFLGDFEKAKNYYLKCMKIAPLNEMAYYNYADILTKNDGNYKEAIYYYKYAIDIKADYTKAHYWLGEAYVKLGMNTEACESFKRAEKLGDVKAISQRLWYCR